MRWITFIVLILFLTFQQQLEKLNVFPRYLCMIGLSWPLIGITQFNFYINAQLVRKMIENIALLTTSTKIHWSGDRVEAINT